VRFGTFKKEGRMSDSVYRVTEVIGTSSESWEAAAANAVATAAGSVRDLRVAEVMRQDVTIENGAITSYRVRLGLSFKYESGD
jgi:flavin-binding protein dodecin